VVLLYLLLILVMDRHSEGGAAYLHNLPYFLSYTSNWFIEVGSPKRIVFYHAWSLATEEQFYFLWPWVVRFSRSLRTPVVCMLVLLFADQIGEQAVLRGFLTTDLLWVRMLTSIAAPKESVRIFLIELDRARPRQFSVQVMGVYANAPQITW
jgi:peptidoglycan/LPS O-acetylase OafA/YrhL